MFIFTIKSYNKSIYFIEPNTQPLDLLEFYTKCYKLKYLPKITYLLKLIFVPLIISSK